MCGKLRENRHLGLQFLNLVVDMFKLHVLKKAECEGEVCNAQDMELVSYL